MVDLSTKYLGLNLENPIVVSSSGFTSSIERIKRCAESGAGAVVLKSLFEEQVYSDNVSSATVHDTTFNMHPEAFEYIQQSSINLGSSHYIDLIKKAKDSVSIPIIGSLNCISEEWWNEYAEDIENSGVDAIELNMSSISNNPRIDGNEIEEKYLSIFRSIKSHVDIPIVVKIGPYFSSIPEMVNKFYLAGAKGVVLFNRFYQIGIDPENFKIVTGFKYSAREEISNSLRWVSILSNRFENFSISGSIGVHDTEDLIKMLLAGADVAQICSTLYLHGVGRIREMLDGLSSYMERHSFEKINDFRGRLSQAESDDPMAYERLQYIKAQVGAE